MQVKIVICKLYYYIQVKNIICKLKYYIQTTTIEICIEVYSL